MAIKKAYDEASVIRVLSNKNCVQINKYNKTIEVLRNNTDVGNGSWGKIDYLKNVHGYIVFFVDNFSHKSAPKKVSNEDNETVNNKVAKREAKFNMAAMAKSAMRKAKTK